MKYMKFIACSETDINRYLQLMSEIFPIEARKKSQVEDSQNYQRLALSETI